jgi:glyoxylase-like metal-dependent hydrolase (beta-lactamase superfamily II)
MRRFEDVYKITGTLTNNMFLVDAGEELVVIDPGMPFDHRILTDRVRSLGRSPREIGHILLTHFHVDHSGSTAALERLSEARAYCHRSDAPYVERTENIPSVYKAGIQGNFLFLFRGIVESVCDYPPARVHHPFEDREILPVLGGLKVFHTPGHTPGSTCYLWLDRGVLFSGDAVVNQYFFPTISEVGYCWDFGLAGRSAASTIEALEPEDVRMICTGHGPVITNRAKERLQRLGDRLRRRGKA